MHQNQRKKYTSSTLKKPRGRASGLDFSLVTVEALPWFFTTTHGGAGPEFCGFIDVYLVP